MSPERQNELQNILNDLDKYAVKKKSGLKLV